MLLRGVIPGVETAAAPEGEKIGEDRERTHQGLAAIFVLPEVGAAARRELGVSRGLFLVDRLRAVDTRFRPTI